MVSGRDLSIKVGNLASKKFVPLAKLARHPRCVAFNMSAASYAFSATLAAGGLFGYLKAKSLPSLVFSAAAASLFTALESLVAAGSHTSAKGLVSLCVHHLAATISTTAPAHPLTLPARPRARSSPAARAARARRPTRRPRSRSRSRASWARARQRRGS